MGLPSGHDNYVYPQPLAANGQVARQHVHNRGLTLLDQLVIAALPIAEAQLTTAEASYQGHPAVTYHGSPEDLATRAYDIAEAVLNERLKRLKADSNPSATV